MQTSTVPTSLEDKLFRQFYEFERRHGILALVPAFDITQGKACLRVNIHYPQYSSKYVGRGYSHEIFGFENEAQLRTTIINYLTRELHLGKKKHRESNE